MTFCEVLQAHMATGALKSFCRLSEPHIHYDFDASDGLRFWAMNHETDDLEEHSFSAVQIFATDWTI